MTKKKIKVPEKTYVFVIDPLLQESRWRDYQQKENLNIFLDVASKMIAEGRLVRSLLRINYGIWTGLDNPFDVLVEHCKKVNKLVNRATTTRGFNILSDCIKCYCLKNTFITVYRSGLLKYETDRVGYFLLHLGIEESTSTSLPEWIMSVEEI